DQWFSRRIDEGGYDELRSLLEPIVAAREIPDRLLEAVVGDRYTVQRGRALMGSLMHDTQSTSGGVAVPVTTLCHKSLADWLGDPWRSGTFFVDAQAGARRVADTARALLIADREDHALRSYVQGHLFEWHETAQAWAELEGFLLRSETPLLPYWRGLDRFPADYDDIALIERLWSAPDRREFLGSLQRDGDSRLLMHVLSRLHDRLGFAAFDIDLVAQFVDTVHLTGDYPRAVALCDDYLAGFSDSERDAQPALLALQTRRLHHSMFFQPVGQLRNETEALYSPAAATLSPDGRNEL